MLRLSSRKHFGFRISYFWTRAATSDTEGADMLVRFLCVVMELEA